MRIVSVRFKNLNSLRGEFFIDFDSAPLADSGLYAITGPTGAGKTTLLDAITVALYNKVPRHGSNVHELMTRHTGECWSEVTFETGTNSYRSRWSLNRARGKADGALQGDKMELCNALTNELLSDHRKTNTLNAIEQITGLDYEQFLRSVMLAQGEFSRFLKAKPSERSLLLEQMTDTAIFSRISLFVFDKTREEKKKVDDFALILGQYKSLSADEIAENEATKNELTQQSIALGKEEGNVRKDLKWWQDQEQLETENIILQQQWDTLSLRIQEAEPSFEKLHQHQKAAPHKALAEQIEQGFSKLKKLKEDTTIVKEKVTALEGRHSEQEAILHKTKITLQTALDEKQTLWKVIEQTEKLDADIQNFEKQKEDFKSTAVELIKERKSIEALIAGQNEKLTQCSVQFKETEEWLKENKSLSTLETIEPELIRLFSDLNNTFSQKVELDSKISATKKEIISFEENIAALSLKTNETKIAIQTCEANLQNAEAALFAWMEDRNENEIRQSLQQLPADIEKIKSAIRLSDEYGLIEESIRKGQSLISTADAFSEKQQKELNNAQQLLHEAKAHGKTLQVLLEKETLLHRYEAERMELTDGNPCPLCGALHHPFAEHPPVDTLLDVKTKINDQEQKIEILNIATEKATEALQKTKNDIIRYGQLLETRKSEAELKQQSFNEEISNLNDTISITEKTSLIRVREEKIQALKNLAQQWEGISAKKQEVQTERDTLTQLHSNLSLQLQEANQQQQALDKATKDLDANQKQFKLISDTQQELEEKISLRTASLHLQWQNTSRDTFLQEIRDLKNEFQQQKKKSESLQNEMAITSQTIKIQTENLSGLEKRMRNNEDKLNEVIQNELRLKNHRTEIFGDKNTLDEKRRLTTNEEQTRNAEKEAVNALQETLIALSSLRQNELSLLSQFQEIEREISIQRERFEKIALNAGFENSASLIGALINDKEAAELLANQQSLKQEETRLEALRTQHKAARSALEKISQPEKTKEILEAQLATIASELATLHQSLGAITARLEEDARQKLQHAARLEEQEQQQQAYHRWDNLNRLIGSATGDKFRSFAQGLTLQHLTQLANRHLAGFSSRYTITKKAGDNLELEITDAWQADIARPISTLSGGETFLVSLALALGLSDLASNKVQIKSLFIDEGFGTLDAETLDTAMDALENLREAGKSIGVISHVEAMKERIQTQIQVVRTAGGYSSISIKSI
jgi:DNA repair protein SbcC/Rad50